MNNFAIVITAYNRAAALQNLLNSLQHLKNAEGIKLVISIDNKGTPEVNQIAQEFEWKYGSKDVIIHEEKLGLRKHFIWAGDQTSLYEHVIFLEDDLLASAEVINFARTATRYYADDEAVAGICLYNPILCEFNGCKYYQNQDGYDIYFLQHPYWGNIWSRDKWNDFKAWWSAYECKPDLLPRAVSNWRETSFKKVYIQYLIEKNKYIVVPRISLVTNNGEAGLHNSDGLYQYQTVLMNETAEYRFCLLKDSMARYDAYMEIDPEILKRYNSNLAHFDFDVDLKGNRHYYEKEYVLTTRPVKKSIKTYSSLMKPEENGVIYDAVGTGISLCKAEDVLMDRAYDDTHLFVDMDKNYHVRIKTALLMLKATVRKRLERGRKK